MTRIPGVGALIFNRENKVLLIRSSERGDRYCILCGCVPYGCMEFGKGMEDALRRVVQKSTGLCIHGIKPILAQAFISDEASRGEQRFILYNFVCETDADEDAVTLSAEEYVWVSLEEALDLPLCPYTRGLIEYLSRAEQGVQVDDE